jgi:hypothetical protein
MAHQMPGAAQLPPWIVGLLASARLTIGDVTRGNGIRLLFTGLTEIAVGIAFIVELPWSMIPAADVPFVFHLFARVVGVLAIIFGTAYVTLGAAVFRDLSSPPLQTSGEYLWSGRPSRTTVASAEFQEKLGLAPRYGVPVVIRTGPKGNAFLFSTAMARIPSLQALEASPASRRVVASYLPHTRFLVGLAPADGQAPAQGGAADIQWTPAPPYARSRLWIVYAVLFALVVAIVLGTRIPALVRPHRWDAGSPISVDPGQLTLQQSDMPEYTRNWSKSSDEKDVPLPGFADMPQDGRILGAENLFNPVAGPPGYVDSQANKYIDVLAAERALKQLVVLTRQGHVMWLFVSGDTLSGPVIGGPEQTPVGTAVYAFEGGGIKIVFWRHANVIEYIKTDLTTVDLMLLAEKQDATARSAEPSATPFAS